MALLISARSESFSTGFRMKDKAPIAAARPWYFCGSSHETMMYLIGRAGWLWFNQSTTPKPSNCWPNVSPAKLMSTSIKSGRPIQNFFRFRAVLGDDCEVTGILDHLSQGAQRDRVILNSEYPFCAYRWHVRLMLALKNQRRNHGFLSSPKAHQTVTWQYPGQSQTHSPLLDCQLFSCKLRASKSIRP